MIEGVGPATARRSRTRSTASPTRTSHQIFLEPKAWTTHEIYPNGISHLAALRRQLQIVRSIRGLENAHILRPGYAIEYDFRPAQPRNSPGNQGIGGLFFAGQINGTTGYEEAAAQGLLAGANAALQVQAAGLVPAPRRGLPRRAGRRPDHARRFRAYRMFTQRAPNIG